MGSVLGLCGQERCVSLDRLAIQLGGEVAWARKKEASLAIRGEARCQPIDYSAPAAASRRAGWPKQTVPSMAATRFAKGGEQSSAAARKRERILTVAAIRQEIGLTAPDAGEWPAVAGDGRRLQRVP